MYYRRRRNLRTATIWLTVIAVGIGLFIIIRTIKGNNDRRVAEEYWKQVESRKATPEFQATYESIVNAYISDLRGMREDTQKSFDAVKKQSELRSQALEIQDELTQWKKEIKTAAGDPKAYAQNKILIEARLRRILSATEDLMQENIENMKVLFSGSSLEEKTISLIVDAYIKSSDDAKELGAQLLETCKAATKSGKLSEGDAKKISLQVDMFLEKIDEQFPAPEA